MAVTEPLNRRCIEQLNQAEVEAALEATRLNLSNLLAHKNVLAATETDLEMTYHVGDLLEATLTNGCYYVVKEVRPDELVTAMIHTDPTHVEVYPIWRLSRKDLSFQVKIVRRVSLSDITAEVLAAFRVVSEFQELFLSLREEK